MPTPGHRRRGRRAARTGPDIPVVWSRQQLLALLAAGAVVTVLLGVGLVLAVVDALRPPQNRTGDTSAAGAAVAAAGSTAASGGGGRGSGPAAGAGRDELAARPMPTAPQSASHPMRVSRADPGEPIVLPPATGSGPAGVPTGFDHTPEGALAQLAAIDSAALSSASLPGARAVIAGWAVPGGPTPAGWSGVRAMAGLLDAAGVAGGTGQLAVLATPAMGLVKGTVGPDFVVACVDFAVDVTVNSTARGAVADCQRMVWTGQRWMIGAGAEPAEAPSVWPSTDLAYRVGYRDLRRG